MAKCRICELPNGPFNVFADVCDGCARYDWGHWRIRLADTIGTAVGALAGLIWAWRSNAVAGYARWWAVGAFAVLIGAVAGRALASFLTTAVFNQMLIKSEPAEAADERQREAEKFFYISLLSAHQGKVRYAIRMLEQARRHGWQQWERLTSDPRLDFFSALETVRGITGRSS